MPARGTHHRSSSRRPKRPGNAQVSVPGFDLLNRRLAASEAAYRALAENLPFVVYLTASDVHGSFSYISPQVERLLGYTPAQVLADRRFWAGRLHPADKARVVAMQVRAHREGGRFVAEYRLVDRAGRAHWVRDEAAGVHDADGKLNTIQGTWTEITHRRAQAQEIAEKEHALTSSASDLNQFVSISSHEFKAPLRRIGNLVELLERRAAGKIDEEDARILAQIRESAATMQQLLAGLVHYAEADRPAALRPVDAGAVLERALSGLASKITQGGARITHDALPSVHADAVLLESVLSILIDNAIKFRGDEPPAVHVSARRSGTKWLFSVRDNGMGMEHRQLKRIFALFDRIHARGQFSGQGIGLALARKMLDRMGGNIWAASEPGEGSTFSFTLRALEDQE